MNEETKVLLLENDKQSARYISMALKAAEYSVTSATTGKDGILSFCTKQPNIILMDLDLPDMDGMKVLSDIRKISDLPIIIVSGRDQDGDKIAALDAGANDYVTKPFSMGELLARIRVAQRLLAKNCPKADPPIFHYGDLTIDTGKHQTFLEGKAIHLTPLEYKLLVLLAANGGKVVTHSQITKEVWGYNGMEDSKGIRVCLASLRHKIEKDSAHPRYIFTEIGVGYRFTDQ